MLMKREFGEKGVNAAAVSRYGEVIVHDIPGVGMANQLVAELKQYC